MPYQQEIGQCDVTEFMGKVFFFFTVAQYYSCTSTYHWYAIEAMNSPHRFHCSV